MLLCLELEGKKFYGCTKIGYLSYFKRHYQELILDKEKYDDSQTTIKDAMASPVNNEPMILKDEEFSDRTLNALFSLGNEELQFIILRFQEQYTDEEMAKYYNISVDDVKRREKDILASLRSHESINFKGLKYS